MILDEILAHKRREVARARDEAPLRELRARAREAPPARDFIAAVARPGQVNVIAEIKRASPSKGLIRADFDPEAIAASYTEGGAAAISVLTDRRYFQGEIGFLAAVKARTPLPLLRKDFIVNDYQLYESLCAGADAVLLIAAALAPEEMRRFLELSGTLGLKCLVEVHDRQELEAALETDARVIGINNRDLRTFQVSLETTEVLAGLVPDDRVLVSESGIFTRADVERVAAAGVSAVLVGEALMRSPEILPGMRALVGVPSRPAAGKARR